MPSESQAPDRAVRDRAALLAATHALAGTPLTHPWEAVVAALGLALPMQYAAAVQRQGAALALCVWDRDGTATQGAGAAAVAAWQRAGGWPVDPRDAVPVRVPMPDAVLPADTPPCVATMARAVALPDGTLAGALVLGMARAEEPADAVLLDAVVAHLGLYLGFRHAVGADSRGRDVAAARAITAQQMASILSHEVRNPLSAALMSVSLLLRAAGVSDALRDGRRGLEVIRRSAHQINRVVQDLVDAASLDAGALTLHRETVSVEALVQDAVAALYGLAESRAVTLDVAVEPDLPGVFVQRDRVVHALLAVLTLPIRMVAAPGTLTVRARAADGMVMVDMGGLSVLPAISDLGSLFDLAAWVHGRTNAGAGIGVCVAHAVVTAHGGRLWVDTPTADTMSFHLALPVAT